MFRYNGLFILKDDARKRHERSEVRELEVREPWPKEAKFWDERFKKKR